LREGKLDGLCHMRGFISIHDFEHVAANVFILMLVTWCISLTIGSILSNWKSFRELDLYHKRNCITYVLEILFGTAVLLLQLAYGWDLMVKGDPTNQSQRQGLSYAALLLTGLYTYELLYRVRTHWQLALHHMIAIGVLMVAFFNWFDFPNDSTPVVRMCCVFVLHASTEQTCFLALLLHRLYDHHTSAVTLKNAHAVGALSSYFLKTSICVITWILWVPIITSSARNKYSWFWLYVFPVLNTLMLFVQWWAASIFVSLRNRFVKILSIDTDQDVLTYKNRMSKKARFSTVDMADLSKPVRKVYHGRVAYTPIPRQSHTIFETS